MLETQTLEDFVGKGFAHGSLFDIMLEENRASDFYIDALEGHYDIWRERFRGIDQEYGMRTLWLVINPKRDDIVESMVGISNPESAVGKLESGERGRDLCVQRHGECRYDDEEAKECVVKEDRGECDTYRRNAKCPIPIRLTFDVLVFVCIPAQYCVCHGYILLQQKRLPRRGSRSGEVNGLDY